MSDKARGTITAGYSLSSAYFVLKQSRAALLQQLYSSMAAPCMPSLLRSMLCFMDERTLNGAGMLDAAETNGLVRKVQLHAAHALVTAGR